MQNVWNDFYKERGRFYILPHPSFGKVITTFRTNQLKKVLDLGCGSGRHSLRLAREGFDVTGIDFSQEAIDLSKRWAASENLSIDFRVHDFREQLPFADDSFDAVVAIDSITYDTKKTVRSALLDVKRILRKNGMVFLTLPTRADNPLVSHLLFEKEEAIEMVSDTFQLVETFMDNQYSICITAMN